MVPEKYAVNHIDKQSNEDFINCEFHLAESLKMKKRGSWFEFYHPAAFVFYQYLEFCFITLKYIYYIFRW